MILGDVLKDKVDPTDSVSLAFKELYVNVIDLHTKKQQNAYLKTDCPGLQITVGHWTMADQNLPMSDEIPTLVGHLCLDNFFCLPMQTLNKFYFKVRQTVRHMSFQEKKLFAALDCSALICIL